MKTPTLSFERAKAKSVIVSLAYRIFRLTNKAVGQKRMLKFWLKLTRIAHRFAHEGSGLVYGDDYYSINHAPFKEWIKPGSKVIDIGCGDGRWSALIAEFTECTGVDQNQIKISDAQKRNSKAKFISSDAREIDFETFDTACLIHVLEHIDEPVEFLKSLSVQTLIVEVPDFDSDILNYVRADLGVEFYSDADHVCEYTEALLRGHLERSEWKVIELRRSGGTISAWCER